MLKSCSIGYQFKCHLLGVLGHYMEHDKVTLKADHRNFITFNTVNYLYHWLWGTTRKVENISLDSKHCKHSAEEK